MSDERRKTIPVLLEAWSAGDQDALSDLIPLVYDELKRIAKALNRGENPSNTLQTTAVLNEALARILAGKAPKVDSQARFFGFVAKAIRNLLVETAIKKKTIKRGRYWRRIPLEKASGAPRAPTLSPEMTLALDAGLSRLAAVHPRQARVVELRFFGGLKHAEIAKVLDIGHSTVRGDWRAARKFLARELTQPDPETLALA